MTSKRRVTALCCAADGSGHSVSRPADVSEEQLRVTRLPWWIQLGTRPTYSHTPLSTRTPQACSSSFGSEAATEVSSGAMGSPGEEEENGKGNRRCSAPPLGAVVHLFFTLRQPQCPGEPSDVRAVTSPSFSQ